MLYAAGGLTTIEADDAFALAGDIPVGVDPVVAVAGLLEIVVGSGVAQQDDIVAERVAGLSDMDSTPATMTWYHDRVKSSLLLAMLLAAVGSQPEPTNLVANGDFASDRFRAGVPDFWQAAGNPAIHQQITRDSGREGGFSARLDCSEFSGAGGDSHAMLCQVGQAGVRRGQWYRLSFWSKAANLKAGAIELGLSDTRTWQSVGLAEAFSPGAPWEHFEFRFQAQRDLPGADSRLQFYHRNTGTFWLADVSLVETPEGREWFPQIATEGVKNFIPNSSFECSGANWGSYTYDLPGWAGNLYRLEGVVDTAVAEHGRQSLKIALNPRAAPVFYFDYYEPVRQPVRRVLAANRGWFRIKPGEPLTLSAYLCGDSAGLVGQLALIEAPEHLQTHAVTVSTNWQRFDFSFTPTQPFVFIAVGLDLEASHRDAGTLWVTQALLPLLDRSAAPRVINVSSGAGQLDGEPQSWAPAYSISKTALNMLTQQLTAALPRVMVNSMCPGWCRTEMGGPSAPLSADEGADTLVWLALDAPQSLRGSFVKQRR